MSLDIFSVVGYFFFNFFFLFLLEIILVGLEEIEYVLFYIIHFIVKFLNLPFIIVVIMCLMVRGDVISVYWLDIESKGDALVSWLLVLEILLMDLLISLFLIRISKVILLNFGLIHRGIYYGIGGPRKIIQHVTVSLLNEWLFVVWKSRHGSAIGIYYS